MIPLPSGLSPAKRRAARIFEALVLAVEAEEKRLGRPMTDEEIDAKFDGGHRALTCAVSEAQDE